MSYESEKTVYIVNQSGHDFSGAEHFGKISFMTTGSMDRYAVNEMYRLFAEALKDSNKDDYILTTSLKTMSNIACAVFVFMHGRLNLLLYKKGRYIQRTIVLGELINKKEE